jgi:hypothetical protein
MDDDFAAAVTALVALKFVITRLSIEIQHTMFGYVGIIIEEQQPATAEALLRDDRQGHTQYDDGDD